MPRPREFDDDAVLQRVTDVFTAHGYQGTSLAMLTDAAGLGKQSLYNAFGDKRALYLQALDRTASCMAGLRATMAAAPTGRAAVQAFFGTLLGACANPDPAVNTCIVSAGLLEGIDDDAVVDKLRQAWAGTDKLLRDAVQRGQSDGSVRNDLRAAELTDLLMTLTSGLRVSARAIDKPRRLQAVATHVLSVLEPRPT
jgi:TetR/AcrR family transcriptional regulator, transcriptional repressor for nem operon